MVQTKVQRRVPTACGDVELLSGFVERKLQKRVAKLQKLRGDLGAK